MMFKIFSQKQATKEAGDLSIPEIDLAVQHKLSRQLQMAQSTDHYFFIDVVGTCNLKCPSCAVGNMPAQFAKGLMSEEMFVEVLEKIEADYANYKRKFVDLYNWGEPGLHPKLSKLIYHAKERGFGVGISSNLNVFPDLRDTIKASPDYLRISFSGTRKATYEWTHRGGNVYAMKANMYRIREYLDRYQSNTIVQAGFHVYRSNFPHDFLEARDMCDELGFIFAPTIATVMPVEKVVAYAQGDKDQFERELEDKLVIPVEKELDIFRENGPACEDCQFRHARTTINYDGTVALCCASYEKDKIIADDFRTVSPEAIRQRKYEHSFCEPCMTSHTNKLFTGYNVRERNEFAVNILGPLFDAYLKETTYIGHPDYVFINNQPVHKMTAYENAMQARSRGKQGHQDAIRNLDALISGAPDFAEAYFQRASLAQEMGDLNQAKLLASQAAHMAPDNQAYQELSVSLNIAA